MRVTESMRFMMASREQAKTSEAASKASEVAASGLRVAKPSDDPVAYARKVVLDNRIASVESQSKATSAAMDDLSLAETSLASAADVLVRAREIATQMLNGTIDPRQRASAAAEVSALRESLIGQANVKGSYGYLFSGTKTDTPAFSGTATYQGNLESIRVDIGPGVSIAGSASGSQAFTAAGGVDVFATLTGLQTALTSNDTTAMTASIDQLENGHRQIVGERTRIGQILDTLTSSKDEIDTSKIALSTGRAAAVEVDAVSAYTDLVRTQTSYQQALEVTKRILAMSAFER